MMHDLCSLIQFNFYLGLTHLDILMFLSKVDVSTLVCKLYAGIYSGQPVFWYKCFQKMIPEPELYSMRIQYLQQFSDVVFSLNKVGLNAFHIHHLISAKHAILFQLIQEKHCNIKQNRMTFTAKQTQSPEVPLFLLKNINISQHVKSIKLNH